MWFFLGQFIFSNIIMMQGYIQGQMANLKVQFM